MWSIAAFNCTLKCLADKNFENLRSDFQGHKSYLTIVFNSKTFTGKWLSNKPS